MTVTPVLRYERDIVTAALRSRRPLPPDVLDQLLLPRMGEDLHRRVAASPATPSATIGSLTLDTSDVVQAAALANPNCPPLAVGQVARRYPPAEDNPHHRRHRHIALHHPSCPPWLVQHTALDTHDPARLSAWSSPALTFDDDVRRALQREPQPTWIAAAYTGQLPHDLLPHVRRQLTRPGDIAALLTRHRVPDHWWQSAQVTPAVADAAFPAAPHDHLDQLIELVPPGRALRVTANPAASWSHLTRAANRADQPIATIARHRAAPPEILDELTGPAPELAAAHPATPNETLRRLADHPSPIVRNQIARNPNTPTDCLEQFQRDPQLTAALITNPASPHRWADEEVRAAVARIAAQQRHQRPSRHTAASSQATLF